MSLPECRSPAPKSSQLASYLTIGVTGAVLATPHAEAGVSGVVTIDLTNVNGHDITGLNGGIGSTSVLHIPDWLGTGSGQLSVYNGSVYNYGLGGGSSVPGGPVLEFAVDADPVFPGFPGLASPTNLAAGSTIDGSLSFGANYANSVFSYYSGTGTVSSPDFGANRFMGFRFSSDLTNWNYGYLEVTWNSTTQEFFILSGAYESAVNVGITTPVPAPSALALLALGGGAFRRARARPA